MAKESSVAGNKTQNVLDYMVDFENKLGKGAVGKVFLAVKPSDGSKAAVKQINGEVHPKIVERADDIYHRLDRHENIVNIHKFGKKGKYLYIFMEHCAVGDLNKFFKYHVDSETTRLQIKLQIAEGLRFLHSKKIIHRDMKPDNILVKHVVEDIPSIKLSDFDFSRHIDRDYETTIMTSNVGTLKFKAPEFWMLNAEGEREYRMDVDIYATGLVFLAITQHKIRTKLKYGKLLPILETPKVDSEIHNPIGGTIYERIKYNPKLPPDEKGSLDVVKISGDDEGQSMKILIKNMTMAKPENRIRMDQVVSDLEEMIKKYGAVSYSEGSGKKEVSQTGVPGTATNSEELC